MKLSPLVKNNWNGYYRKVLSPMVSLKIFTTYGVILRECRTVSKTEIKTVNSKLEKIKENGKNYEKTFSIIHGKWYGNRIYLHLQI